jgi:hypothetical protein
MLYIILIVILDSADPEMNGQTESDQPFETSSGSSSDDEQQETLACAAKEGGMHFIECLDFSFTSVFSAS